MIRGNIAIPEKDPKTWRSRGRKRKQPVIASAIVTPPPLKKRLKGPVIRLGEEVAQDTTHPHPGSTIFTPGKPQRRLSYNGSRIADGQEDQPRRSAIVEPKKPGNSMLAHLLDDYDPEEHRRAGEKADELFRTIVRRVAASKS